jgi:hypothetical protein
MHNPIEMMMLGNPLDPGCSPAPYRSANKPGDAPRQDHGGDLYEIRKNEDLIEQVLLKLLEVGHHVLPDRERFDFCLPGRGRSAAKSDPGWQSEYGNSM